MYLKTVRILTAIAIPLAFLRTPPVFIQQAIQKSAIPQAQELAIEQIVFLQASLQVASAHQHQLLPHIAL